MSRINTNKSVIIFAATILLLAVWLLVFYLPGSRSARVYSTENAELETELQQLNALFQAAGQSTQSTESVQSLTSRALSQLTREDSLAQFIDAISGNLSDFGLRDIVVTPVVEAVLAKRTVMVGDRQLKEVLFSITVVGRYLEVGKAISYIEEQPYFSDIRMTNLAYDEDFNPSIVCEIDLSLYLRTVGAGG